MTKTCIFLLYYIYLADWLSGKYPQKTLENSSPDIPCQRLKKFYQELKKSPKDHYSPSAHLSIRAALDRYLSSLRDFSNISIIRDQSFKAANKSLNAKLKLIKSEGQGKVHHHSSISAEDIKKCYETKVFGDETPLSLLRVNWFNISLHFCRRGRENQRSLTKESFEIRQDGNGAEYVAMTRSESTKNHQGGIADKAADEGDPKMFSTGTTRCPVKYFKKLLAVLNPNQMALFQKPKRNFTTADHIWFENSPIGVNSISTMMKKISIDANLSQVYSNHCVRSTTITALDVAGIPIHRIMQTSGHRNEASVKFYCDRQTLDKDKESSNILARFGNEFQVQDKQDCYVRESHSESETCGSQVQNNIVANVNQSPTLNFLRGAAFNNCNVTFNIVKQ